MFPSRSATLLLIASCAVSAAVALLLVPAPGQAQRIAIQPGPGIDMAQPTPPLPKKEERPGVQFSAIKLIENNDFQELISTAADYIKDKSWRPAATALQNILDSPKDYYAQVKRKDPRTGEDKVHWVSVKYEANNLLGSMPDEGLDVYELREGQKARTLLVEAKVKGDPAMLADVAQRYMHTGAGIEANDLLATTFLDRGQYFMAALRFERLLSIRPERAKLSDMTLFKATLAYRRAGDLPNTEKVWSRLEGNLKKKGGLKVGEQVVAIDRLKAVLDEIPRPTLLNPYDWPRVGGNLTHTAQAMGTQPLLDEVLFSRPTFGDKSDETGEIDRGAGDVQAQVEDALTTFSASAYQPIMPGYFPIAAEGMVVYRTYNGIAAFYLRDLKDAKGQVEAKAGSIAWKSTEFDGALATALSDKDIRSALQNWLDSYKKSGFLNLVYENSAVGTLSTDHRLVYAVDDLGVPAPPDVLLPQNWNSGNFHEKLKHLVSQNSLQAFELTTGRTLWRLGDSNRKDEFTESHFLGTPISVGGKLYVLNEKNNGELRLLTLDPNKKGAIVGTPQVLGTVSSQHRLISDISRRASAVFLGYGEGILVCPTNAGELLGVDLMSRTLAWAYPYRQEAPNPRSGVTNPSFPTQPGIRPTALSYNNWKAAPPFIQDGKVVFTAPDASSVHCINLRDGTPRWTNHQLDSDVYLAGVFDDKVLIVGKSSVRTLRLSDGAHLWSLPTGNAPSGQGVASNNVYYQPLRNGEICAIDLRSGLIKAHNRASRPGVMPGNLIFYEGVVLSQTARAIVAYPQLTAKLQFVSNQVKDDPNNMDKLFSRGELYLADGQVQSAVSDLQTVLQREPSATIKPKARQRLFEALTGLLQLDFDKASTQYLEQYHELSNVPGNAAEQEQRLASYLRILGQGRESQGNLVEAFKAYREFGSLPSFRDSGVPSIENPAEKTPTSVWLRGRVSNLLAKATAAQRRPLEERISEEWQLVRAKKDPNAIRSFAAMFDVPFHVGREARLELAEAIMDRNEKPAFLEAELNLQQLRGLAALKEDPSIAGRALEAMARLEIKKSTPDAMKLASSYYRELSDVYGQALLRDGKTGRDLFNELTADKRFLPYLEETSAQWGKVEFKYRELQSAGGVGMRGFVFEPKGDVAPLQRQYRVMVDVTNSTLPKLKLIDMIDGKMRLDIDLGNEPSNNFFIRHLYNSAEGNIAYLPNARFRFYHVTGHLAVVQFGTVVYGVDLESTTRRPLWQYKLLEAASPNVGGVVSTQVQVLPDQELWQIEINQFGQQVSRKRVGHVGVLQPNYVALTSHKGLVVLDPLRGQTLWTKHNIPPQTELFGDEDTLYMVDTSPENTYGAGRAIRAIDGTFLDVKDFGHLYRHRIRVLGRQLLLAEPGETSLNLRLYDVRDGKDIWSRKFNFRAVVMESEDPNLAGVIEPDGKITVLDVRANQVVLDSNVAQGRVTLDDLKTLQKPWLVKDAQQFYVALNQPVSNTRVMGGILSNNFHNGLRCMPVNGWFVCFDKAGEFQWHLEEKTTNQMLLVDQFHRLPILIFTVRYYENQNFNGAFVNRPVSYTGGVDKLSGKVIGWPREPRTVNVVGATYHSLQIDPKNGEINLLGAELTSQFYVNDGRKRPGVVRANVEGDQTGPAAGMILPGIGAMPAPAIDRINRLRILEEIQPPLPDLPAPKKDKK